MLAFLAFFNVYGMENLSAFFSLKFDLFWLFQIHNSLSNVSFSESKNIDN